ncbi:MAG: hypothetical protein ACRD1Y_03295 [Terriglobales bacterium]
MKGFSVVPAMALLAVSLLATPPKKALKSATAAAEAGQLDKAFLLAKRAADAHPNDSELVAASALLRARALLAHLRSGEEMAQAGDHGAAALQFRAALALDPASDDARNGLAAQYGPPPRPARPTPTQLRVQRAAPPVNLLPASGRHSFHLRLGVRQTVARVTAAYGLSALIANDVRNAPVHLDVTDANFAQTMTALRAVSGLAWIPLDSHTLYVGTVGELHSLQPFASRTYYLPWVTNSSMLSEITTVVRSLLGIREATTDISNDSIVLRARPEQLDAAERLLLDMHSQPGQVVLQVRILALSTTTARALGLSLPAQFTMFTLGPLLAQLQSSGTLSQQILALFQQGGLNAVLNSGLLSPGALASAQSLLPTLLQNPFVTFGGGATLMGLSIPAALASFNESQSRTQTIETAMLRAQSGQPAELDIGERYPVINASFAPISLNPALQKVIGNNSYAEPFPSFTFEKIGLDAKITPRIGRNGEIRLQMDLAVTSLTGSTNNNIPIISNQQVTTAVSLHDGEPVLVAGLLNRQQMRSLVGLPGLSAIPGFAGLFSTKNLQTQNVQLALLITPHLVRLPEQRSQATWLPSNFNGTTAIRALPALNGSGPRP